MAANGDIFEAAKNGNLDALERLLKTDPSLVHARDEDPGAAPLHYATVNGHREIAEMLSRHGAEVNAVDRKWAATPKGSAVEYLLEHRALLGIQMADFIHAVKTEQVEWVRRWMKRNPHYAKSYDEDGRVSEHAKATGNAKIIDLIESTLE